MIEISTLLAIAGVLAAFLVLTAYYLLESGKLSSNDPKYYLMNGISSLILIVSIAFQFDLADTGAIFMEVCWVAISLKGLLRSTALKT